MTIAIARSQTGATFGLQTEKARLAASDMVTYGNSLRPVISRMLLLDGVKDTNSPAGSGIFFSPPSSPVAPHKREVFATDGGKAAYIDPPPEACLSTCAYAFTGQITVTGAGDDAAPELSMILVDIPEKVCGMINRIADVGDTIPSGDPLTTVTAFNGTNYGAATAVTLDAGGHRALCYHESGGDGRYIYVNVVHAR